MMLWITIVMDVIFIFLTVDYSITRIKDMKSKESTWIKETRYPYIPLDYICNGVLMKSECEPEIKLKCKVCGCVYIPTPNCESSPTPKYCPECGRKMINWKEIKI